MTAKFPYDQSEIGRRRLKAAGDYIAEVGRQAGLEAMRKIRLARLREGLPVESTDESPPETPAA